MNHEQILVAIYEAYPRRIGRRRALLEIDRAIKRLTSKEEGEMTEDEAFAGLLQATIMYARSPAGRRGGFTPHPATWFHQSRYLDDSKEWQNVPITEGVAEQRIRENREAVERVLAEDSAGDGYPFQQTLERRRAKDLARPSQLLLGD